MKLTFKNHKHKEKKQEHTVHTENIAFSVDIWTHSWSDENPVNHKLGMRLWCLTPLSTLTYILS